MTTFISALHSILKPFLLRRLKSDVLSGVAALPPKKSYVLYAGLSGAQKEAYEAVVGGGVREWVAGERMREGDKRHGRDAPVSGPSKVDDEEEESVGKRTRGGRKGKGKVDEDEERRRAAEAFRLRDAGAYLFFFALPLLT
jgi:ATP-dependent DNA helicase